MVADIPGAVVKGAPDFCNVYVVAKEKIHSMRAASRPAPASCRMKQNETEPLSSVALYTPRQIFLPIYSFQSINLFFTWLNSMCLSYARRKLNASEIRSLSTRSNLNGKSHGENHLTGFGITFVSSERPSIDRSLYQGSDIAMSISNLGVSFRSETDVNDSMEFLQHRRQSVDMSFRPESSLMLTDNEKLTTSTLQARVRTS